MASNVILPPKVPVEYTNEISDEKRGSSSDIESGGLEDHKHPSGEPAGINAIGHLNVYDDHNISDDDESAKNVNAGVRKVQQAQAVWGKVRRVCWPRSGWEI